MKKLLAKKLLAIAALLLPLGLFAAASVTPTGAAISTNGWIIELYWTNLTIPSDTYTNAGGMNLGFDTNRLNVPTNPMVTITVTAPGFSTAAVSNNSVWKTYGTWPVRLPYPNFTNIDTTTISATNCSFKMAMSDYIGPTATASVTIAANAISNNVTGTFTATNSSTQKYPKVIGNWAMPDYQLINSSTFTVKAVIPGEPYGRNGQPVACVVFTATDQHSHTVSVTNTTCAWDRTVPDQIPVPEYTSMIDASTMTDKDNVSIDFKAYPWVGTSTEVLDTSATGWGSGTPFPHTLTYVLNKNGGFSKGIAKVATNGVDATGVVTTNGATPTASFLTLGGALTALEGTNNFTSGGSNNTPAGGFIYMAEGNYAYTSGPDDAYRSWVYILPHPTNVTAVTLTNGPGTGRSGTLVCFSNITQAFPVGTTPFFNYKGYWLNSCTITNKSISPYDRGIIYYTFCTVNANDQGFNAAEALQQPVHLLRGSLVQFNRDNPWDLHTIIGNLHTTTNAYSGAVLNTEISGNLYQPDYSIVAFNAFLNVNAASGGPFTWYGGTGVCTNGARVIQNIFEQKDGAGASTGVTSDSATGSVTNFFLAYNVFAGFWNNLFYNDSGTNLCPKLLCIEKGNSYRARKIKSDTFTGVASSNRLGNWSAVWSVANSGNASTELTNTTVAGGFMRETPGVFDYQPRLLQDGLNPRSSFQNPTNWPQFTTDGGWLNGSVGAGNGNYRLKTTSPMTLGWEQEWLLPIDIEGKPRGRWDPPGPYTDGNARHGGLF